MFSGRFSGLFVYFAFNFFYSSLCEILYCELTEFAFASATYRNESFCHFLVAHNEHIRNFLQLSFSYLVAYLFVSCVNFYAQMIFFKYVFDLVCVFNVAFAYGKNLYLNGSEPERESACVMLGDDTDKSFD